MPWNYTDLATTVAALDFSLTTTDQQVVALNAQATTSTTRQFSWVEARRIAFKAGVWANIVLRSPQTPSAIPPANLTDGCIITAITATSYMPDDIMALATHVVPDWEPPVTNYDTDFGLA